MIFLVVVLPPPPRTSRPARDFGVRRVDEDDDGEFDDDFGAREEEEEDGGADADADADAKADGEGWPRRTVADAARARTDQDCRRFIVGYFLAPV
mmetsp:Transcript_38379/g.114957  ORF Transcript_38379/g.114957 Transcript_38379/m.114957 type:complete len:95 (+) Transcript_38379:2839-3123(+)